jgi:hypothetical protein
MVRLSTLGALIVLAGVTAQAQNFVTIQDPGAEALFKMSRQTLGGEGTVANLKTLVLKGNVVSAADDGGPPERDVEIRILLPAFYLRIDTAPGFTRRSGMSGDTLISEIRSGGEVEEPPSRFRKTMLNGERARLARMLLGIASTVTSDLWLTLRTPRSIEVGSAFDSAVTTSPSERRLLEASGKDAFYARIIYDGTALPVRVDYPAPNKSAIAITFDDRRVVSGLKLPHRIVTQADGKTIEELRFTQVLVNQPLTRADFRE